MTDQFSFVKAVVYFVLVTAVFAEDLYNVLGIGKGASTQEIKSAYKKLAREWWALAVVLVFFFVDLLFH